MSRKFVGKLIRIMMTKSSSCDILKKKRTIRRGSGSRPKGPYLMDLRFWNYVIPDGSTTFGGSARKKQRVLELCHSRWFYYSPRPRLAQAAVLELCHSRWFYYQGFAPSLKGNVLELCHSRWFYYYRFVVFKHLRVLELCHSRWFYYNFVGGHGVNFVLELCHSRWFYYTTELLHGRRLFWNYVIPDGSTT